MNNELGDNNNIESDEGKNIKFDPINELDDDEKISTSFTINESDDEKKSSVNNEENEDFIFEKQIIPLSANQVNDESGTSEIRHVKSNGSVPEDDQKFTISYHSAKMKYESGLEYNKKIAIKYEEMIKISKKLKPSIQGNEKQSDIKYEEVIKSNASGAYPTRLIQDKNNIVEYEGVVKNNNKKLVDNNDVIKENEESEKNLRETHQSIFVGSDFKVISKRLDELRPDSADSVKLDDDKKISVNNTTINGSNNEKILLVNNQKNDESIIEEHITPLSTNQVNNDESGALEIQYVKSNEFFSENKNLDAPINTAFLEKNNFHIKGDINSDQMKYKSGSRYNKKIVTKYEEMTKNNKKLTQTCIIPDRILHGSCVRCHNPLVAKDWCKSCQTGIFKQNFKNWASGNSEVDELIQNSQLEATDSLNYLEWIDHKEIVNIEYITKGGFGKIFKGIWIRGPRLKYSTTERAWDNIPNTTIALKELNNQEDFNQFLAEVRNHRQFLLNTENHVLRCFGITRSPNDNTELAKWLKKDAKDAKERPKLNSYMMVMMWANDGDLFNYIKKTSNDENFTWYKRLKILEELSGALKSIHDKGVIHQDLHCGNILMNDEDIFHFPAIGDLGLCGNYNKTGILIGVKSFIAPEHLKENPEKFTTASDIYSFGIIMWIIGCCKLPYEEFKNDQFGLEYNITVGGLRPKIPKDIPTTYAELMKRCWDDNPEKRPKAFELRNIFSMWEKQYYSNHKEFFIAEKERLHKINNSGLYCNFLENQEIERSKLIHKKGNNALSCKPFDEVSLSTVNFENSNNNNENANLLFLC
ncbi:kinase-like domain-containing protein [Rhizophagus irregularis DAOM 181602=DAOM 197198]|nr:kinase-like domain-containing protein [Rhizophagus irregularis DAOM 181602=DAOM 197198]